MKVAEGIHALKIPFRISAGPEHSLERFVYCYLVCGDTVCLIDSGVAGSQKVIFDYLVSIGRKPEDISILVLTHSYPDHMGAARAIREATGCTVAAHLSEKSWIEDIDLQFRERPVSGLETLVAGSVKVDRVLKDGDILNLGSGFDMEVFHTPGHSRGSLSLFLRKQKVLFCADAVLLPGQLPIYDDNEACTRSVNKLKYMGDIEVLLSSWDDPKRGPEVLRAMDESLTFLRSIQRAVFEVINEYPAADLMAMCEQVVRVMGLPPAALNPLVASSLASSLEKRRVREP